MPEAIRILCVDDEPNVLKALRRLFSDDNYELVTVGTGQEGLEMLRQKGAFHLVISDYRMPEMNGVDFLKEVCAHWPETIRIVLSGYADTASVVDAINQGQIYKFIPKPWNDDELKVTIQNAVEVWQLNRENDRLNQDLQQTNDELLLINENLEQLVVERTAELQFQNEALEHSQRILANLPVAVIGLEPNGLVVYLNAKAIEIFKRLGRPGGLLGEDRQQVLPAELNRLVDQLVGASAVMENLVLSGRHILVLGQRLARHSCQEGLILVLVENE